MVTKLNIIKSLFEDIQKNFGEFSQNQENIKNWLGKYD